MMQCFKISITIRDNCVLKLQFPLRETKNVL